MERVARLVARLCAVALALGNAACGVRPDVVRVYDGRTREERFVSPEAYAASLEAAIAEERGDWSGAAAGLDGALRDDPHAPELEVRLGRALCRLGDYGRAMKAFERAVQHDPESERAYTERAVCGLSRGGAAADRAEARRDLLRAIAVAPDAIEPTLALVDLDLDAGELGDARARAEEAAASHPSSARVLRWLAQVAARQGDVGRAVAAAKRASALDEAEGARGRDVVIAAADLSGAAAYALDARDVRAPELSPAAAEVDPGCGRLLGKFDRLLRHATQTELETAGTAVAAACPVVDALVSRRLARAAWNRETAAAVEAAALASTAPEMQRWAIRMRLRHARVSDVLLPGALPRIEDRETLALHLAARAALAARGARSCGEARGLAAAARRIAIAEPTVARLVGEVARTCGEPAAHPWRRTACDLAVTRVESEECGGP